MFLHGSSRSVEIMAYHGDVQTAAAAFAAKPELANDPDALANAAQSEGQEGFVRLMLKYEPNLPKRMWGRGENPRAYRTTLPVRPEPRANPTGCWSRHCTISRVMVISRTQSCFWTTVQTFMPVMKISIRPHWHGPPSSGKARTWSELLLSRACAQVRITPMIPLGPLLCVGNSSRSQSGRGIVDQS